MTTLIKKMKSQMKESPLFMPTKTKSVDSLQNIDKVNGMNMFQYPNVIYTLR